MAFQLDSNIFMQGAALRNQNQQNFFDQLSRGIASYERKEARDLRQRQLEAKAQEKANDPKRLAQEAILQELMAKGMSREEAAMKLMYGTESVAFDPYSATMTARPSKLSQLGISVGGSVPSSPMGGLIPSGGAPAYHSEFNAPSSPGNIGSRGQGSNPALTQNYDNIAPKLDLVDMDQAAVESALNADRLTGRPQYGPNVPGAMKSTTEAAIDRDAELDKYAGKKNIDLKAEKLKDFTKEELNLKATVQEAVDINSNIKKLYENADFITTGFVGESTKGIAGTPAHDFSNNLKVLESDAGLSKLIEVKERGGTFGALQEKELELLVNSRSALAQSQSPDEFRKNLSEYQEIRNRTIPLLAEAFKQKYGKVPDGLLDGLNKNIVKYYPEGQTAVNPETGDKLIYEKGKWRPM